MTTSGIVTSLDIDLETPMGRGFMAMMSAMAEDERLRIIKRTQGRKIAPALSPAQAVWWPLS